MTLLDSAISTTIRTAALAAGLAAPAGALAQAKEAPPPATLEAAERAGLQRIGELLGNEQGRTIRALAASGEFPVTARAVTIGFGEIYRADSPLDLKTRELVTVATLAALGHAEPQLRLHLRGARAAGASREEIYAVLDQLYAYVGMPTALNAIAVARDVLGDAPASTQQGEQP